MCKECMAELPYTGKSNIGVHNLRGRLNYSFGQFCASCKLS